MGSCFPGSSSLLCSPVVCKCRLRYLIFVKFLYCIKKKNIDNGKYTAVVYIDLKKALTQSIMIFY